MQTQCSRNTRALAKLMPALRSVFFVLPRFKSFVSLLKHFQYRRLVFQYSQSFAWNTLAVSLKALLGSISVENGFKAQTEI